jgi:cation transporter-like permease
MPDNPLGRWRSYLGARLETGCVDHDEFEKRVRQLTSQAKVLTIATVAFFVLAFVVGLVIGFVKVATGVK